MWRDLTHARVTKDFYDTMLSHQLFLKFKFLDELIINTFTNGAILFLSSLGLMKELLLRNFISPNTLT